MSGFAEKALTVEIPYFYPFVIPSKARDIVIDAPSVIHVRSFGSRLRMTNSLCRLSFPTRRRFPLSGEATTRQTALTIGALR